MGPISSVATSEGQRKSLLLLPFINMRFVPCCMPVVIPALSLFLRVKSAGMLMKSLTQAAQDALRFVCFGRDTPNYPYNIFPKTPKGESPYPNKPLKVL